MRFLTLGIIGVTLLASCGPSAASGRKVPSLNSASSTTTPARATTTIEGALDPGVAFARCMRDHGVEMPDPQGGGIIMIDGGNAAGQVDQNKVDAANAACESILREATGDIADLDPAQVETAKKQMLGMAKCMRDHGVDFPDPVFSDKTGTMTATFDQINTAGTVDGAAIEAASKACGGPGGGGVIVTVPGTGGPTP